MDQNLPGAIADTIDAMRGDVAVLRHELHQRPEIRYQERWTSARVARWLEEAGIPFKQGYAGGTGIVAELEGGRPGGRVALRADIDALEVEEETGLPYASLRPGFMHACGHDGHTAVVCGLAAALKRHREDLPGVARFIFQPAEELGGGGEKMVAEGAVAGCDGVFALHGWPDLPLGTIGLRPGPMMAAARDFHITVHGKDAHAAAPEQGIDPVVVAAHIVTALQTIASREMAPGDPAVVTVAQVAAGSTTNIIPEAARLAGTFRAFSDAHMETLRLAIARIAEHTASAHRARADVAFGEAFYPAVHNDPDMTELAARSLGEVFGPDAVRFMDRPCMAAEDFAYYLRETPGTFLWLGVAPPDGKPSPNLHSSRYDFPDAALPVGMRVLATVALARLRALGQTGRDVA
jgi:amidohydrolase